MYYVLKNITNKWIICGFIWRIIVNEICLNNRIMPLLCGIDMSAASEPFFHADRKLSFHVLIYVIEGVIYVTEEGTDYEVREGELLFLKSGCRHFGKKEVPRGTRWYYCHFFYEEEKAPPFLSKEASFLSVCLPKKLEGLRESEIERKLADLTAFARSDNRRKNWEINGRFFSVLEEIAFYNENGNDNIRLSDKIADFLKEHLTENFSAKELEKKFFLSYKHMAAVFKRETQTTLFQYHQKARMDESCRLLKSTVRPVGEIARSLGYQDMLYFSRCFRQFTGMSPVAYRKSASGIY